MCSYSLEINFVHLESGLKDAWSQNSATQQILVDKNKKNNKKNFEMYQKGSWHHKDVLQDFELQSRSGAGFRLCKGLLCPWIS